jgi:hypothetical protein
MEVHFHRTNDRGNYAVLVRRDDGLTARLPGYDRTYSVPHDLAHFVAERGFELTQGVFGSIAAGAMFSNMSLVDGRPHYDGKARSRAVLRAHADELGLAECISGVVHESVENHLDFPATLRRLHEAWGRLRPGPCPYEGGVLRRTLGTLGALGARWRTVEPGDTLALRWELPVSRR